MQLEFLIDSNLQKAPSKKPMLTGISAELTWGLLFISFAIREPMSE